MDRLLSPLKFDNLIAPHIKTPMVIFTDRGKDKLSFGAAVKVNDKGAIGHMHRLVDRFALYMNQKHAGDLALVEGIKPETYHGLKMYTHPFTLPIPKMFSINTKNFSHLTFGLIGDWFYVNTSPEMHKACIDAYRMPLNGLMHSIKPELSQYEETKKNWISLFTRSSDIKQSIEGLVEPVKIKKNKSDSFKKALKFFLPTTPESRLLLAIEQLTHPKALNASITLQLDFPTENTLEGKFILKQK